MSPKRYIHTSNKCICEHFVEEDFYFQQDGTPLHYHHDVTSFLNERLLNRWIGQKGFVEYPPRSPYLTPLDYFLCRYLKDKVYALKPTAIAELRATIERECMQITDRNYFMMCATPSLRVRRCLDQNGYQFEKQQ